MDKPKGQKTNQPKKLTQRRGKLLFALCRSQRYCSKLESHYDFLINLTLFFSLLGGILVVADLSKVINITYFDLIGSIIVLSASLMALVFQWSGKSRLWGIQKRGYISLIDQFYRMGRNMTEPDLDKMRADLIVLEAWEDETKRSLMLLAHNEECSYRGVTIDKPLGWFRKTFACYLP